MKITVDNYASAIASVKTHQTDKVFLVQIYHRDGTDINYQGSSGTETETEIEFFIQANGFKIGSVNILATEKEDRDLLKGMLMMEQITEKVSSRTTVLSFMGIDSKQFEEVYNILD